MESVSHAPDLAQKHCKECNDSRAKLNETQARQMLAKVKGWEIQYDEVTRAFKFKNFYQTMGFVNAIAFIANRENHHPDLEVGYDTCKVRFSTHSVGGLSENDFICAAKVNALIEE